MLIPATLPAISSRNSYLKPFNHLYDWFLYTAASTIQSAWLCHAARQTVRRQIQIYLKGLAQKAALAEEERRRQLNSPRQGSPDSPMRSKSPVRTRCVLSILRFASTSPIALLPGFPSAVPIVIRCFLVFLLLPVAPVQSIASYFCVRAECQMLLYVYASFHASAGLQLPSISQ